MQGTCMVSYLTEGFLKLEFKNGPCEITVKETKKISRLVFSYYDKVID